MLNMLYETNEMKIKEGAYHIFYEVENEEDAKEAVKHYKFDYMDKIAVLYKKGDYINSAMDIREYMGCKADLHLEEV